MKARVFTRRADAEAARDALDAAHALPRDHAEGTGADDFRIARPGAAVGRIRAAGVRTEHYVQVITHPDGTRFAVPDDDPRAEQLDESWRATDPRR